MIIRRMRASFGCLDGQELHLDRGLNVIEAANESGKSTWCAFLRCMLYGVSTSARVKGGVKPDKLRYAPWNGKNMEGELELEYRGVGLTLRRNTLSERFPMREFSAVYTASGEPAAFLSAADAGEQLTGATSEVFQRTAFIFQGGMNVENNPELERRITAILSSGEEDASYSEAEARLRTWQRRRRFHNRGHLPELESEITGVRAQLDSIRAANRELMEMESLGEESRLRLERLQSRLEQERRGSRSSALRQLEEVRGQAKVLERNTAAQRQQVQRLRAVWEVSPFYPEQPETLRARAARDAAEAEKRAMESSGRSHTWLWILLLALSPVMAALSFVLAEAGKGRFLCLALAAALLLAGALVWLWDRRDRQRRQRSAERLAALLTRYHAAAPEDIHTAADTYVRLCSQLKGAEDALEARLREEDEAAERQRSLEIALLDNAKLDGTDDTIHAFTAAERELSGLRETCAMAKGRLDSLGDKLVLESRLQELEERRVQEERQYRALQLALDALQEANTELQSRFSPELARRTAAYFARLTGERYTELSLDKSLTALVRRPEDTLPHENSFLSRGACDQFYLALRLALCEMTLDGEEKCPLILDDALLAFDEERMALAMELLWELSGERQIILFSCQHRESEWLERKRDANK